MFDFRYVYCLKQRVADHDACTSFLEKSKVLPPTLQIHRPPLSLTLLALVPQKDGKRAKFDAEMGRQQEEAGKIKRLLGEAVAKAQELHEGARQPPPPSCAAAFPP